MSHLHHIAASGTSHRQTLDQAQARPGGQDKYARHFLKQKKKDSLIKTHFLTLALTLTLTCTLSPNH